MQSSTTAASKNDSHQAAVIEVMVALSDRYMPQGESRLASEATLSYVGGSTWPTLLPTEEAAES